MKAGAESLYIKFLNQKASKSKIPLSGTFELSPCCNMDCKMCYVRKSRQEVEAAGGEINADAWIEMGRQCRDAGMLFLLLTGGEPFLYKDFKRVYIELIKMGFVISINSNGTLINEETVEWLKKYPPTRINMTLYGASNETYNRLCGNPKGFDQTIKAVKLLKDAGISVKFNASMTPENIDDLDQMYEIAKDLNVYIQASVYMFPPVRKDPTMIGCGNRFSAEQAAYYQVKVDKKRFTDEQFELRVANMRKAGLISVEPEECVRDINEPLGCRAGRTSFWINWKGQMTACGMMTIPTAYPFVDGFNKAWNDVLDGTKKLHMPYQCVSCKLRAVCSVCGASTYTETGDFNEAPPYLCEMTKKVVYYTTLDNEK